MSGWTWFYMATTFVSLAAAFALLKLCDMWRDLFWDMDEMLRASWDRQDEQLREIEELRRQS